MKLNSVHAVVLTFILPTAEFCSHFSDKNVKRLQKCFSTTLRSKYHLCLFTQGRKSCSQAHDPTMCHIMSRKASSSVLCTVMIPASTEFLTSLQCPFGLPSSQFKSVNQEEHIGPWQSPKELTHHSHAMKYLNGSKHHMDLAHDKNYI